MADDFEIATDCIKIFSTKNTIIIWWGFTSFGGTVHYMEKDVTIYDIAAALGLSAATVSRALKDHPAIHSATKGLVRLKAEEMGYRRNAFASNLRRKRTNILGVIVPRLNSSFMSAVLAGMERVANDAGYNLLIAQSLESSQKEIAAAATMFNSRVDGLLVSLAYDTDDLGHLEKFRRYNIPLVFFDRVPEPQFGAARVIIDNFEAGREATRHLLATCSRVMHVTGNLKRNVYAERFRGYLCALEEAGLVFSEELLLSNDLSVQAGAAVAGRITGMADMPEGLFIANDLCAIGFIQSMKEKGYPMPATARVVGFNDDPIAGFVEPQLTTIQYQGELMGETALTALIRQLNGQGGAETDTVVLSHRLIVRTSS